MSRPLIILASTSPRRRDLMQQLGLPFTCQAPQVEENNDNDSPSRLVLHNALIKAQDIARHHPHAITIGSDTTVALDDHILNKPKDLDEASRMLQMLSGRRHQVLSAVAILCPAQDITLHYYESSYVTFRSLSDPEISHYFTLVNPLDKAGAYGIQEHHQLIIDHYQGSFNNIMGLPTETTFPKIKDLYHRLIPL